MRTLIKWNLCFLIGMLWAGLARPLAAAVVFDNPPWLTNMVSGSNLILSWPSDHIGWMLEVQTNAPGVGITTNWNTITGSSTTNLWTLPIDPANGSVFSRLAYGPLFSDDFTRATDPGSLAPWAAEAGTWTVTGGVLEGGPNTLDSYGDVYITNSWGDYSLQAQFQFPAGAFGGGLGGRLDPATGSHYGAWIYPENSPGGSNVLKLVKFQTWTSWGYTNSASVPMAQVNLASVGTNWHTLMMVFQGAQITVDYDTNEVMSVTDVEAQPYLSGAVSLEFWTDATAYTMSMDNVGVNALP
ncbi:MAG: hypothetical protein ACLQU3_29730 [Limisphaerales bacterium]